MTQTTASTLRYGNVESVLDTLDSEKLTPDQLRYALMNAFIHIGQLQKRVEWAEKVLKADV